MRRYSVLEEKVKGEAAEIHKIIKVDKVQVG